MRALGLCTLAAGVVAQAQTTFSESFTGTTANGWAFGGNYLPNLTANTIDTPGNGWLRLTDNANNRSTYALLDTEIFSVNARIEITMDYAFYNGTGADGITFFLVDGSVTASSFDPGSYGGSMGYAQRTGEGGLVGGYLGFALDNYGNYSNGSEGRNGGLSNDGTLYPNRVAVRGPESSNYAFIAASNPLPSQMDFPTYTSRPSQTGADYRSFKIILDANNQLEVLMKFGTSGSYATVFTADLSGYERPETFKIGFTGATGGSTEIHEVRNVSLVSTPWSSGSGAYEWDDAAGTDNWGGTAGGEANTNWYSSVPGDDNKTPLRDSDILFGARPSSGPQTVNVNNAVEVRNMTFDSPYDYTLSGSTITFGDTGKAGLPSINVNNYNEQNANGRHKINNALTIVENIAIRNFSYSTLCLNGAMNLGANTLTTSGYGLTNLNGQITGSGPIVVNGAEHGTATGIVTVSANNSSTYTGAITVNGGQLVVLHNNALGNTGSATTVNDGGTLTFRGGIATAEPVTINGAGTSIGRNELAGAIYNDGGNNTLSGTVTLGSNSTINSRAGTLTLTGQLNGTTRNLTKTGAGVVSLEGSHNMWNGAFVMQEGALRFNATSFNTGVNYQLAGGVLEIGADLYSSGDGDLAINIGTGNNNLQWTGDGGFSAFGADRAVRLNYNTDAITWGSANFVQAGNALILGSSYANATVTLENSLSLGGTTSDLREIRAVDGALGSNIAAVDGRISGRIRGNAGLLKTGDGTLDLSWNPNGNNRNDYSGATEIRGGALRISADKAFSNNSNLVLNGGVLEIGHTATYSQSLGTGGSNLRWTGDGGFSAVGSDRTININGGTGTLTWASTGNFVANNQRLIFGSTSATGTVVFGNGINLNNATRTIHLVNGSAAEEVRFTGDITNGSLLFTGNGTAALTRDDSAFSGDITVRGAELVLRDSVNLTAMDASDVVRLEKGGRLVLDYNTAANDQNFVSDTSAVRLSGGSITSRGDADQTIAETAGALHLDLGANTVDVQRANTSYANRLTFQSLNRAATATVDFANSTGGGTLGTSGNNPGIAFTSAPTLDDGILAYATVNGSAFATHGTNGIAAAATDTGTWDATKNMGVTANVTLGFDINRQVNSVNISNGALVNFDGRNVDVQSGGILAHGSSATGFTGGGTLTSSSGQLVTHVYGSGGFTIQQAVTNSGATSVGLVKSGDGTLTLSGTSANTYTGVTTVNAGTLVLNKSAGVNAIGGNLVVGDGRGVDTVRLDANEQIGDSATVTLRGGELGNSANVARLEMNGAANDTFGSRVERFAALNIEGNTVLDFGGGTPCSPTFLYLDFLNIAANSLLTITNWIEFTDFLLVDKTTFDSSQLSRVVFDGYDNAASWKSYDADYYQIIPFAPVPEPAAYGVLSLGGIIGLIATRRRRRPAGVN